MKILRISRLICFTAGAVLILIFKNFFVENLRWFIGGLVVLYGAIGILGAALEKSCPIRERQEIYFNSVEILIGLIILIFVKEYSAVCIIWAVWSILRESIEIKEIVDGELHLFLAIVSGIESVAVIVLSVMLITEPGRHHALIHTYLLCIELLLTSSIPVLNHCVFKKKKERHIAEAENESAVPDEQTENVGEPASRSE